MNKRFRIDLAFAGFLFLVSIIGMATAADVGHAWEEQPFGDNFFSGVMFSTNGSMVFSGGNQILVRSWDGKTNWGGWSGNVATMSADGNRIISALENKIRVIDRNGGEVWTRSMNTIQAVGVSVNGSIVVAADDRGFIHSWNSNGETLGMNQTDLVKKIAISPSSSFIVATTETGLKFFSPDMNQYWADNTSGTLDTFIAISADSSTVIASGDRRVSSHDKSGTLNWMKDVTDEAIIDMACSEDATTIVLGSQDGNILVLNQLGKEQWKYPAGSWINGVGVSRDGSVIAAGTLERDLYILNKGGQLLAKTRTDAIIQQRSVAVSRDGKRIVVADQIALYGFELLGLPEATSRETFTPAPLFTATSSPTCPICATLPKTLPPTTMTTLPVTTSTPASPLNPCLAIVALSGLLFIAIRRNN